MRRAALLLVAVACGGRAPEPRPTPPSTPSPVAEEPANAAQKPVEQKSLREVGLDPDKLDRAADPCDDFYRFACGTWVDKTEIPADLPSWTIAAELKRRNDDILKDDLAQAAKDPGDDAIMRKLGSYERACMDETAIEEAGVKALSPLLARIATVKNVGSLATVVAELHRHKIFVLFRVGASQDYKKSTDVIAEINQSGLGLPDRDYYLRTDDASVALRAEYQAHVARMLGLTGQSPKAARKAAADVLKVELALAKIQVPRVELRDPVKTYNRIERKGLAKAAPALAWDSYFKILGYPDITAVTVKSPAYIQALGLLVTKLPATAMRAYLTYQTARSLAEYLPGRFQTEGFALQKLVSGLQAQPERWRRCVGYAGSDVGELLAQPFVKKVLSPEARDAATAMIKEVGAAFGRSLSGVAWMDAATQEKAAGKLAKLDFLVGYPDEWRKYDFAIDEKNFAATHLAAQRYELAYELRKVGKPVNRGAFQNLPQEINAYYDPSLNQMVLLAGILQQPFYNARASVPVNLGGIGMVVGHELTHGFDDEGAQFDADGNLSGWWPDDVTARFKERTQCVADAYSRFEVLPGLFVNGQLTLGENIADIGGLKMAFRAYRALRKNAATTVVADGFSEDQQFFLAHAQTWCGKLTEAETRRRIATDPHSPRRFRVTGPLSNLREFATAFQCKPGSKMRPEKICEIW